MDYVGEIIALSVDGIVFLLCLKQYLKSRHVINELKDAPIYEISPELEGIVRASQDQRIPFGVVRGPVKAIGVPIDSSSAHGVTGVIQKITVREHVVSKGAHGFWTDRKRVVQETNNSVPFVILGKRDSTKLEVLDAPTHAEMLDLTTISDKFQPTENMGIVEHVWGYFTGIRRRGIQTTEEMLKEGSIVTGVGEITLNKDGPHVIDDIHYALNVPVCVGVDKKPSFLTLGQGSNSIDSKFSGSQMKGIDLHQCSVDFGDHPSLRLQQPSNGELPLIISHLPLPSLVTKLESRRKAFGWVTAFLGLSGLVIGCWIAYRWMSTKRRKMEEEERRRRREMELRQRRKLARTTNMSSRASTSDSEEAQLCVVCRENPKELILLPCGHVCLCDDCSALINDKCPVCRTPVESVNVAFIA